MGGAVRYHHLSWITHSRARFRAGVGVISGWVCDAERIDIVFNPGTPHCNDLPGRVRD